MNGIFTLDWENIKSAIIYGALTSFVVFALTVANGILANGSIYGLDWAALLDKGTIAVIGVLVTFVSLLKNLLTDNQGKFLGVLNVVSDKEYQVKS